MAEHVPIEASEQKHPRLSNFATYPVPCDDCGGMVRPGAVHTWEQCVDWLKDTVKKAEANAEFYERSACEAERYGDEQFKMRAQAEIERDELRSDPYKGQWKRKYIQAAADRDAAQHMASGWKREARKRGDERDHTRDLVVALDGTMQQQATHLVEMEGEVARLRVCGTCGHQYFDGSAFECEFNPCGDDVADEPNDNVHPTAHCCFSPPCWTPYWEREEVTP